MKFLGLGGLEVMVMFLLLSPLLFAIAALFALVFDLTREKKPPVLPAPVLETWQTHSGFTALGVVASVIISYALAGLCIVIFMAMSNEGYLVLAFPNPLFWMAPLLIGVIVCAIYLLFIYPTYFGANPRLHSSKVISFMNAAFGGALFGLLWNHNLTARTKGGGYIAMGVVSLIEVVILVVFAGVFGTAISTSGSPLMGSGAQEDDDSVTRTVTAGAARSLSDAMPELYVDEANGVKLLVPQGWTEDANSSGESAEAVFVPSGVVNTNQSGQMIGYQVDDLIWLFDENDMRRFTRADIDEAMKILEAYEGEVSDYLSDCEDESVSLVTVNGRDFVYVTGSGFDDGQGASRMPAYVIEYRHTSNGIGYRFIYYAWGEAAANPDFAAVEELVESARFPAA